MQLSAPEPTPRARINWILDEEMLRKMEVFLKIQQEKKREPGMVGAGCREIKLGEQRAGLLK